MKYKFNLCGFETTITIRELKLILILIDWVLWNAPNKFLSAFKIELTPYRARTKKSQELIQNIKLLLNSKTCFSTTFFKN